MTALKKLKPINDRVLFVFLQNIEGNQFQETTKSGIQIIENKEKQLKGARWGKVISVGENVSSEISEGLYILIEPLSWTLHAEFQHEKFWNTSEDRILAISTELPK